MAGFHPTVELVDLHSVINHPALPVRQVIHPAQLALQRTADGNDSVSAVSAEPFLLSDRDRRPVPKIIPATPIFGRMHGQHRAMVRTALPDPHQRTGSQPVVRMY